MEAVHYFFRDADQVFYEERLGDEFFDAVNQWAQALFNIRATGHEQKRDVASLLAAAQLVVKLAAVEARHLVIAKDDVGRIVDGFQQRVTAIVGDHYVANVLDTAKNQLEDERIVFHQEQLDGGFPCGSGHRSRPRGARFLDTGLRRKSPLLPPVFSTR